MTDESIEKIAHVKLGMVKPGERVFVDLNRQ
jgi:cell division protein FtsB